LNNFKLHPIFKTVKQGDEIKNHEELRNESKNYWKSW